MTLDSFTSHQQIAALVVALIASDFKAEVSVTVVSTVVELPYESSIMATPEIDKVSFPLTHARKRKKIRTKVSLT